MISLKRCSIAVIPMNCPFSEMIKAALGDQLGEKRNFERAVESFGLKKKVESAPQLGANNPRSTSRLSDVKPARRHSVHAEGDFSKARSSARSSSKNSRARTPTR